jgi:O-glycosyl hydrolase
MKISIRVIFFFFLLQIFSFPAFAQKKSQPVIFKIDTKNKAQVIENFGAAGCWFSEGIGKYWPEEKKEQIAAWLFSKSFDKKGNPEGIGLSAWRFNIGGGTAEQGDSSGIKDFRKRVESFQNPDGSYDWNKQAGYLWFVRKAKSYGVENLIAFSNTPPVQFTQNGRGFKTEKDYKSNLKPNQYGAYAGFLTDVIRHFDAENLHFNYISPVNEPQWDWSNKPGQASQEGTPWRNEEIYKVTAALDSALTSQKLTSKIMLSEAGMLNYLYAGSDHANRQIQNFFGKDNKLNVRNLQHTSDFIGGHSYFTDNGDSSLVQIRKNVADTTQKYKIKFWQTEYSMLADGFREGTKDKRSAIDCALFLAKVIHNDLAVGNASAWQLWNSYEPGSPEFDTRYFLIALKPNEKHTDGEYFQTKGLWAFGNFSRFIRPGMQRLNISRSDKINDLQAAQDIMLSAYMDNKGKVVVVAINYTTTEKPIKLDLSNAGKFTAMKKYITSAANEDNLKLYPAQNPKDEIILPARSVVTMVVN